MKLLIAGLVLFLGTHSVRIWGEGWRSRSVERLGLKCWQGLYALLSLAGLALVVWGFGAARLQPAVLWATPVWMRHLAALLTLPAFVLVVAAYVPGNSIRARLRHPMTMGVAAWALAHLLVTGTRADVLLFGSFLVWALLAWRCARQRDRDLNIDYPPGRGGPTVATVAAGAVAWALVAFWAHGALIGIRPFG